MSIRIEGHIRGHIASCNGRVELVKARVEHYSLRDSVNSLESQELQARLEETRQKKEERLLAFQKDVKDRVQRKERARLKQLSDTANRQCFEKKKAKSNVPETKIKERCGTVPVRDEVTVLKPSTAVQQARLSLLSAVCQPTSPSPPPLPNPTSRQTIEPATPASPTQTTPHEERSAGRRYTAPSKLALNQKQSHARQLHLFHRLYSNLERETARQRRIRQTLRVNAEERRRENEVQRRMAEEDLGGDEESVMSCSEEERERIEVWEQTVALEKRRHQLQAMKESERYLDALRAQLRDKLTLYPTSLPPLCSCGNTVWDTHPQTCANNCPFYHNPKAYATALNNLLVSLKY